MSEPGQGYWARASRSLRRDPYALGGLALVLSLFVVSFLAPLLANDRPLVIRWEGKLRFPAFRQTWPASMVLGEDFAFMNLEFKELRDPETGEPPFRIFPPIPYGPYTTELLNRLKPPSGQHWMGTDNLGRDVLCRMIHGAGISLKVGFVAVGIAMLIGVTLGALAGYYGGWVDNVISRMIEIMLCFPTFFLILAVIAFLPPSIYNIMITIGITRWPTYARLVRGEFLKLRDQEFALAARALGARDRRVIFRHILPNSIAPVLVYATFGVASAILTEAGLSFLGFGVQPPTASWGGILSLAKQYIRNAWWLATFPGVAIFLTVTGYNLLGEGLRDALDPRLSTSEAH